MWKQAESKIYVIFFIVVRNLESYAQTDRVRFHDGITVAVAEVVATELVGSVAVSYTHLDVYKRQAVSSLDVFIVCFIGSLRFVPRAKAPGSAFVPVLFPFRRLLVDPDVYKRQVFMHAGYSRLPEKM